MNFSTVRELMDHTANYGNKTAYTEMSADHQPITYSYARLKHDVDALTAHLCEMGLKGKHIGILGINTYRWVVAYLSVLCGLGVVVPLPADSSREGIEKLTRLADIDVILCEDSLMPAAEGIVRIYSFSECQKWINEQTDVSAAHALVSHPDDFSKIIFTSGTTGERRGVMLTQKNMMCIVSCSFVPLIRSVSISILPTSHAFESVCHLLTMIALGGNMFLCTSLRAFPPMVASSGAESLFIVPALAEALVTRFRPFLEKATNLKNVVVGGAPVPKILVERYAQLGLSLKVGYGLSECSPLVSLDANNEIGSVGVVGEYCRVRIGSDNEIQVKGDNVMLGYYKNEAATRAAFTEDGWLKTGDIGRLDGNTLYLSGRIKNLIILSNGENVSPEELETLAVNRVPGVLDALCYAENDLLCAKLFMNGDTSDATLERVKKDIAELNKTLPAYMRIQKVTLTPEPIPVSATGKKVR